MKFSNGYWLLKDGVTLASPAEIRDIRICDGTLKLFVATRPVSTGRYARRSHADI